MLELFVGILLVVMFLGVLQYLRMLKKKKKSYTYRVLLALALGIGFGFFVRIIFGEFESAINNLNVFMSIFGVGYIKLLKMMVIPLIFFAMTTAIINTKTEGAISKSAPKVIAVLIITVMIAALVGIVSVNLFNVDGIAIMEATAGSEDVIARSEDLYEREETLDSMTYADAILSVIPDNITYMFSGQESTATLSTILFAMFLGYAIIQLKKRSPEKTKPVEDFLNSGKEVVLSMVREILKLTPYGVVALMASFMIGTDTAGIGALLRFLLASYFAIFVMYLIHLLIVALVGLSPVKFAKKTWSVLLFGFSSRSSMAAIPMNVEVQTESMGVDDETANMSASFGSTIGQNGCAGIYPAMVTILAAQIYGVELTPLFIIQLVLVCAIVSFGIAGVGGGATFAAVAVLSIMGFDITVAAILVAIEPLIDMARTALNISDSMLSGVVTSKINKTLDEEKYNS